MLTQVDLEIHAANGYNICALPPPDGQLLVYHTKQECSIDGYTIIAMGNAEVPQERIISSTRGVLDHLFLSQELFNWLSPPCPHDMVA